MPEALGQLTQLQQLDLSDNQLTALPEAMRYLRALKELYLHGNTALGLPAEVLGPMGSSLSSKAHQPSRAKSSNITFACVPVGGH